MTTPAAAPRNGTIREIIFLDTARERAYKVTILRMNIQREEAQ
jgi:hypothetical protein